MANIQSSLIMLKTLINELKDKWQQITGIATTSFQQFIASVASFEQGNIDKALNAINSADKSAIATITETCARASAVATQPFINNTDIMWVQEFVPTTNDINSYFSGCTKLKFIEGSYDFSNVTDMSGVFSNCLSLINLPTMTLPIGTVNYYAAFGSCRSIKSIPTSLIINANNCYGLFNRCYSLEEVLCTINSSTSISFREMFYNDNKLRTVPQFDTSNGKDFALMFNNCQLLTTTAEKPITLNLQNVDIWYQIVNNIQNSKINNIFQGSTHINHVAFSGVYDKIASDVNLTVFGFTYLNEDSIVSLFKCFRPVDVEQGYTMTLNATQKAWEITLTAAEALERFEDEEMAGTYTLEDYSGFLGFDISV